jgi:hypothetical protein
VRVAQQAQQALPLHLEPLAVLVVVKAVTMLIILALLVQDFQVGLGVALAQTNQLQLVVQAHQDKVIEVVITEVEH